MNESFCLMNLVILPRSSFCHGQTGGKENDGNSTIRIVEEKGNTGHQHSSGRIRTVEDAKTHLDLVARKMYPDYNSAAAAHPLEPFKGMVDSED
jgi:hypothetical protein